MICPKLMTKKPVVNTDDAELRLLRQQLTNAGALLSFHSSVSPHGNALRAAGSGSWWWHISNSGNIWPPPVVSPVIPPPVDPEQAEQAEVLAGNLYGELLAMFNVLGEGQQANLLEQAMAEQQAIGQQAIAELFG